jgi:hypothetical protein
VSRWRPTPAEERWLAVAAALGDAVPRETLFERSGGWRNTGLLARSALFVLGFVAAALLVGILRGGGEVVLLIAGLLAIVAAEWLTVTRRLYASGIEEGLGVAGYLLVGAWIATNLAPRTAFAGTSVTTLVLIVAGGAAGLRRLNSFVTTCAAIALVSWIGTTAAARAIDGAIGGGLTVLFVGGAIAASALALGAREYRRPSHDRMLDWLVATLPVAAYAQYARWSALDPTQLAVGDGTGRPVAIVLLLTLGAAMLWTGLRRRRHAPLWGFLGCVAGLAVELHGAVALATETWLILCGLVALAAGVALERYLRTPRNGLTSAPLTTREGPLDLLQIAGAALLAKRTGPEAPPAESTFEGGGGKFGGGGASGRY